MFSESSVNETALNAYGAIILYLKPNSIPAGPAPKILAISLEFTVTIIVFFFWLCVMTAYASRFVYQGAEQSACSCKYRR